MKYSGSNFLSGEGSSKEIIAETCLVALTTISYILPRRKDLVPVFENVLAMNIDQILGQKLVTDGNQMGSILLRSRMSLLLGYYADMLFSKHEDVFLKVINFLISSVALHGSEKVVALQSADTLSTIIADKDLIPRLQHHLPSLIKTLCHCNTVITIKLYFDFVQDFVKYYNKAMINVGCGEDIIPFVQSLVQRILTELKLCHERGERNNLIINKCWNIIRLITELDTFMPTYATPIEEQLKPLFEFMTDPSKIEFEDDIVLTIRSFIKKTNEVSPVMWTLFPLMIKVFEKNKRTFGNLLDTLNQYIIIGR